MCCSSCGYWYCKPVCPLMHLSSFPRPALTFGTSGHVTAKSSICKGVCFINPAFTHRKLRVLPWEVCMVSETKVWLRSCVAPAGNQPENGEDKDRPEAPHRTEMPATASDRHAEVSRRHSRRSETDIGFWKHGRNRNPPCHRKSRRRKLSA